MIAATPASARRHDDWHRDRRHHDRNDNTAAGVAIGVGLLGIAAAVAAKNKRKADERRDADRYGYGGDYFSPAPNVSCYRGERRCFVRDQFSYEWTDRQFPYDPHRRGF
ncbi:hypothetical protein NX02_03980 [Sphingomonas sanxanigenens DSM 19645 = NX02]|uniref:Uncharacterized protein n=1 Tax=Sphingomonas sanxanigenens DSM 19645 = NX02 TaxID=1123269 RepID=W0A3N8_9SPHN|nr:hypothetical protein NX02_03980 [Sphingomonas sanxanigenens DSM 19645 = NX02]